MFHYSNQLTADMICNACYASYLCAGESPDFARQKFGRLLFHSCSDLNLETNFSHCFLAPNVEHICSNVWKDYFIFRKSLQRGCFVQSQKNHGSVVALLSGKFLQIRKVFATRHIFAQNCQFGKEND